MPTAADKIFKCCLDCGQPLAATVLGDQWGRSIDELYYINDQIFCRKCFIRYVSHFGFKRGLSIKDINFVIKEQRFYCD